MMLGGRLCGWKGGQQWTLKMGVNEAAYQFNLGQCTSVSVSLSLPSQSAMRSDAGRTRPASHATQKDEGESAAPLHLTFGLLWQGGLSGKSSKTKAAGGVGLKSFP